MLALDPMLRGWSSEERYSRSRKLIVLALEDLSRCAAATLSEPDRQLQDRAKEALKTSRRRDNDAVEANLRLAERLWMTRRSLCGAPPFDQPLSLVLNKLAQ